MDKKSAKKLLLEHKNALEVLLKSEGLGDVKKEIEEIQESAKKSRKVLKRNLLERIKDLPVVDKISQLGTAGTVAVSTAAVTQADLAQDLTQVFVAEIANDVVEERFEVPNFIDNFVDFHRLNDWGQVIIAEKVQAAQMEVSEAKISVSEPPQTSQSSSSESDPKSGSSSSSQDSASDSPSDSESEQSEAESEKGEKGKGESKSSTDEKADKGQEEKEVEKESQSSEESTEENKGTQSDQQQTDNKVKENSPSSDSKTKINSSVKTPVIHDSIDAIDDVKPHSTVVISPVI